MAALALAPALGLGLAYGVRSLAPEDEFDHPAHAGLFVACASCHRGIAEGDEEPAYTVAPADCARCHDGERAERVAWTAPGPRASNLDFSHPEHATAVEGAGDEALACDACHGTGGSRLLDVGPAPPERCLACHAHDAPEHLAAAECEACHVPLSSADRLPPGVVADFPRPPDHGEPTYIVDHGEGLDVEAGEIASCAICHARESCSRCHLDADRRPSIGALESDPRVADLVRGREGSWPEPPDHDDPDFWLEHGDRGVASCAACHAASSCTTCHRDVGAGWLAELPRPEPGEPSGVSLEGVRPPGHTTGFATDHGAAAGARLPSCESCHAPAECADCHTRSAATPSARELGIEEPLSGVPDLIRASESGGGPAARPGYHIENFVLRHGAEAFAVQSTCSDCHSTEAFCRDCHARSGVGVGGAGSAVGAYHDTQGSWLLGHGAAARRGLEACASCHQQTSCLRCHSARVGLRVNPHGPGFDPDRLAARSTMSCAICHRADQIPPP